jgi:hypothetical protein
MIGWRKVARVRTAYGNRGDVQRRGSRARDGHIRRDLITDRHRPKIQAVWAKAGLRMDDGRLQRDVLRASGGVVGDVEFGRKRTYMLGVGVNLDNPTAPGR